MVYLSPLTESSTLSLSPLFLPYDANLTATMEAETRLHFPNWKASRNASWALCPHNQMDGGGQDDGSSGEGGGYDIDLSAARSSPRGRIAV